VDVPSGEKLHGKFVALYLIVEAADGYRAVFALPEFASGFTDRRVYLVSERDGKPLSDMDGPSQLAVPGEMRAARWVRQVTAPRIRQGN
jgi:hypothetical protein